MGGMMGGAQRKKKRGPSKVERERQEKEDAERKQRTLTNSLAGDTDGRETEKKDEGKDEGGPYKQVTKAYRWVAITGTLDHGQMVANYREALKNPNLAHPQYLHLNVERQTLQPDGTWSSWQKVDADKNLDVLDNLPATEEELAPTNVLPPELVDPLPFLNAGLWEKVHIGSLVPKEKVKIEEPAKNQMGPGGMGGRGMGSMAGYGGGMMQGQMQQQMKAQMQMQAQMQNMSAGMGAGMRMMGGMGGSSESAGNFWKSEEPRVMIRALDFTVEPNESYRYRVQIVVYNPNYGREDVSAVSKEDTKKKTLAGPWSKETDIVSMPLDVEPYVIRAPQVNPALKPKASFQVISFDRKDGWTVPHTFEAGVGDIVGEPRNEEVPRSDGSGVQRTQIDFTSRQIVLDLDGGGLQNPPAGMGGSSIERPAYVALLRKDGAMLVHSQADDIANEFRKDADANYKHEKEQSTKKRKSSQGSGYSGMMQMMMGGMRGGGMR
jgi:hypothetical protein